MCIRDRSGRTGTFGISCETAFSLVTVLGQRWREAPPAPVPRMELERKEECEMRKRIILGSFVLTAFWLSAGAGTAMAAAEDGKKDFEAKKCISCHSLGSQK